MSMPTELWHLIIECYDIKTYKSCMLVNKIFNKITQNIINSIPNIIAVKCHETTDKIICQKCKSKCEHDYCEPINLNNPKELWKDYSFYESDDNCWIEAGLPEFTIFKSDLFLYNRANIYELYTNVPFPIKLILKNKCSVIYLKWHKHGWFCYCNKI